MTVRPGGPAAIAVAMWLTGCAPAPLEPVAAPTPSSEATADATPTGTVRVAIPEAPGHLLDPFGDDVAAQDLAALWGLPLFRIDEAGQLRPALVRHVEEAVVEGQLHVTLDLASGSWSDGTPVTADDVVATIEWRRSGPTADEWQALVSAAAAPDGATIDLVFGGPDVPGWPGLLGTIGVLPADMLDAPDSHAGELGATGGWYRLTEHDPGRLLRFEAATDSPLGAPGPATVEVFVVPSFERALGLLDRRELDVVTGHLAVGVGARVDELDGLRSATALGGTWVGLDWRGSTTEARRAVGDVLRLDDIVDVLLDDGATLASSPRPGLAGPWGEAAVSDASDAQGVLGGYPRGHGTVSVLASAIQRTVVSAGGDVRLISENSPDFVAVARSEHDVALRIFRDWPGRPLARWSTSEAVLAADREASKSRVAAALEVLHAERRIEPLVRPIVATAWDPGRVEGIRPSAWPGLAFWNVGDWIVPMVEG